MELSIKLLTVAGLGALELWAAVPAGLALQLHPIVVGSTAALGATLGALAVVLLGGRVRIWLLGRHGGKQKGGRQKLIHNVWHRFGVIGMGLLAPLLTGAPLGAALGVALGAPTSRLLFWVILGIALWATVLTLAAMLGLAGIEALGN